LNVYEGFCSLFIWSATSAFVVQRSSFSVRRWAFVVQRSSFSVGRSAFGVRRSTLGVRRWAFGVGRSAFDVRRSTFPTSPSRHIKRSQLTTGSRLRQLFRHVTASNGARTVYLRRPLRVHYKQLFAVNPFLDRMTLGS
jgi:hypothetical protein